MMVVDPVVRVVVEMLAHTFDKLVDTLMVVDMMSFDYKIHYKDYLSMMMVVVEEDEMVLLFHLVEIFDVVVVNAYCYHWLMMNKDVEEVHPELKLMVRD
jgi:acetolactate synthase small subunit